MIEYNLVKSGSMEDLVELVDLFCKEGWKPQGGVCVINGAYIQALIRKVGKND